MRDALVVRRHAVQAEGGRTRVRVQDGSRTAMRNVTLGPGDDVDVVVTGGLRAGDVVMP